MGGIFVEILELVGGIFVDFRILSGISGLFLGGFQIFGIFGILISILL